MKLKKRGQKCTNFGGDPTCIESFSVNKARTYLNLSQKKAKRLNQKKMNQVISILRVLYINLLKMEKISWH